VLGVPVYLGDVVQSTLLLVTLGMLLLQNTESRGNNHGRFFYRSNAATLRIATPLIFAHIRRIVFVNAQASQPGY
jgi:hypothetical protein